MKKIWPVLVLNIAGLIYFSLAPSLFQKGGASIYHYFIFYLYPFLISTAYSFAFEAKSRVQSVFMILISGSIALLISLWLNQEYVLHKYADRTWELWDAPINMYTNMIFFIALNWIAVIASNSLFWCINFFSKVVKR